MLSRHKCFINCIYQIHNVQARVFMIPVNHESYYCRKDNIFNAIKLNSSNKVSHFKLFKFYEYIKILNAIK